jgi:hypothetical protein
VRTNCGGTFSEWTSVAFVTVINDEACKAIPLTLGGSAVCGNTALATTAISDPPSNCSTPSNTVWYKYIPATSGTVVMRMTTPSAPSDPLHGWINWYTGSGSCTNVLFVNSGFCSEFGNNGNNDADELISPFLNAGTTYFIMIDGFSGDVGEFCISILPCAPAIHVKIEDILSISASVKWEGTGSFIVEYGPSGFTPGTGATAGTGGSTIIFPATSPQAITGLTLLTAYDVYIRQNCTAAGNGFGPNSPVSTFTTLATPPVNDNCLNAIVLPVHNVSCGGVTAGTTVNATPSGSMPPPSCGNGESGYDDDVWYSFTPTGGQVGVNIEVNSTGGEFDLVVQIYTSSTNNCNGTFTLYQCSDDDGPGHVPVFNSMPVTPGTTYFVRVFSYDKGVSSQFSLCVSSILTSNDNAPGAIALTVGAGCTGAAYSNEAASQSNGEPTGSCSSLTGYSTVWFKFVAPGGGAVRVSTATGSGNTLTNSRVALFSTTDVYDYSKFIILACDEDGGAGAFGEMSVLYATGLIAGNTYYIQVDKLNNSINSGTFCLTVDILNPGMLASNANCSSPNQVPVGSVATYSGWVPLLDAESKLIALVRNTSGGSVSAYSFAQNVNTSGTVRKDIVSGEYYLDRNYSISNPSTGSNSVFVQLFMTNAEIATLKIADPATNTSRLRVTRQAGTGCHPDFVAANGANFEIPVSAAGAQNGVSWVQITTTAFSNFYIHTVKSKLTAKVFLQGAYNAGLNRHKDVTGTWANVLNTYARTLPYNNVTFGYFDGTESVPINFFKSTAATTDIIDWVLVETKNAAGITLSQRAAFVREDGQIVDLDGISPVSLYGIVSGNYYFTIRHRNHLGISTQNLLPVVSVPMGVTPPTPQNFDFTTAAETDIFGDALAFKVINGTNVMVCGNANSNNNVRYGGLSNDAGSILVYLSGLPSKVIINVYSANDVNFDGTVRYGGLNNDTGSMLSSALGGTPSSVVPEQRR